MSDTELRSKCMDQAIEILKWFNNNVHTSNVSPFMLAERIYQFTKMGKTDFPYPLWNY